MTYRSAYLSVLHFSTYLFSAACKSIARPFLSFSSQQVIYHKIYQSHYRIMECFILQKVFQPINPRVFNENRLVSYNNQWVLYSNRWVYSNNCLVLSQYQRVSDENRTVIHNNPLVFNHFHTVSDNNPWVLQENRRIFNKNQRVIVTESQLNALLSFKINSTSLYSII